MTLAKATLNDIYAPIEKDLERFSEEFKKQLASEDELIRSIHAHLLKMSGKYLRPLLTLVTARMGERYKNDAVRLAVAVELIHTATLVHDDVIDDSDFRRNQPSIYSKWGREISIVSGDYLYAKAFLLLASLKDLWVNEAFAGCAHVICEGEMKQIEKRTDFEMPESDYLKIIHQKTAALFQAASMGGAYYAGLNPGQISRLGDYGYRLGMAFQIVDDCLDLVGDAAATGKTAGLDIYKSDVTLPLLYLFGELSSVERKELLAVMKAAPPGLLEHVKKLCVAHGSVQKAMQKANRYIQEAVTSLETFPASPYKESLLQLAQHCVERVR